MTDELLVLGSSSGVPTRRRFPTAYALQATSKLFLLDCGAPVSTLLYRYELDPVDVQAVFLSHWHMDHIANLGLLISQNHLRKRPKKLRIYGPKGSRGKIRRLLNDSFLVGEELSYKLKVTNVKLSKTYKQALLRVKYFKTQHLERPKYKTHFGRRAIACGMIINGPGWRLVYSGDLSSPQELFPHVKGCDLLIHEMAHNRPEAVAEFAAAAKIPHVLISHIGPEFDEAPEKIVAAFTGRYDGDLIVAEDGTRVQLSKIRKKKSIEMTTPERRDGREAYSPLFYGTDSPVQPEAVLEKLETEFDLSPNASKELLHAAQQLIQDELPPPLQPGQVRLVVARAEAPLGVTLDETDKTEVILSLDTGPEDEAVKDREGVVGLRRGRILRLLSEAVDQEGALTQNDLARILNVDVRTIRRDMKALQAEDHYLPSRGQLANDENEEDASTFKVALIKRWLDRANTEELANWLHQAPAAIERYINNFLSVVARYRQNQAAPDIAAALQLPLYEVETYLTLYRTVLHQPERMTHLEAKLRTLGQQKNS